MSLLSRLAGAVPGWAARADEAAKDAGRAARPVAARLRRLVEESERPAVRASAYAALLALVMAEDVERALRIGEELLPRVATSPAAHLALAAAYRRVYAIERPLELVRAAEALGGRGWGGGRLAEQARWLRDGLPLSEKRARAYEPVAGRVVYVVASSRPFHTAGYGARTHALVQAVRRRGRDVRVVARKGYPSDRWDYPRWELPAREQVIDGVPYTFAPTRQKLRYARALEAYHREAADVLEAQCRALRPAVLHAASNYNVGLAACEVGRRLGVPVIYEVRGLWHVSKASAEPRYAGSDHYRLIDRLECQAAGAADHCFAITSGVADALAAGGVARERMSLLPNAADVTALVPRPADEGLVARHGLAGQLVLGYVGSLHEYEGLELLIAAVADLRARGRAVKAVIVGDGPHRGALEVAARAAGSAVVFTGRVSPAEVPAYLATIDVHMLPRRPLPVCELVSPLKPFEAMAMERCVVASDVAALRDIVTDGVTGRLFRKGDLGSLVAVLDELHVDAAARARLGAAARRWVASERSWDALAAVVDDTYRRLRLRA